MHEKQRRFSFGKYKGETIYTIICTHIGYVMWCLNNIKGFQLNATEQALYDAVAISIIKCDVKMTFPSDELKRSIKDRDSLDQLKTPFMMDRMGFLTYGASESDNPLTEILSKIHPDTRIMPIPDMLGSLMTILNKEAHHHGEDYSGLELNDF